jgi:hypothetical protein
MRLHVGDLEVLWPYDYIYPEQYNYMAQLYQALQSGHALLEMPTGTGKCFARGTQLRLYDGGVVAVERVRGGDLLLGDDGGARCVVAGSLTSGVSQLFRIAPLAGCLFPFRPFVVNAEHILVLQVLSPPRLLLLPPPAVSSPSSPAAPVWQLVRCRVSPDGRLHWLRAAYSSGEEAARALSAARSEWRPPVWEVTVQSFLTAPASVRRLCRIYQSGAVTFAQRSSGSLQHIIRSWRRQTDIVGREKGEEERETTDREGSEEPRRQQGKQQEEEEEEEEEEEVKREVERAARALGAWLSGVKAEQEDAALLSRLQAAYALSSSSPRLPAAVLSDSEAVRRHVMAGMAAAAGQRDRQRRLLHLCCSNEQVAAAVSTMAASLGIRTATRPNDADSASSVTITLADSSSDSEQGCYGLEHDGGSDDERAGQRFSVTPCCRAGRYFGFAVSGRNRRFLLQDFTVTHNVSTQRLRA